MDRKANTYRTDPGRGGLLGSTALVFVLMAGGAWAGTQGCALVDGVLPTGCEQANAGQVIRRATGANTDDGAAPELGNLGFSISVDALRPDGPRKTIAGAPAAESETRDIDRLFKDLGIQLSYDGLGARPRLNVSTLDMRRSYVAGDHVSFRASSNYPGWIRKAEVRIRDRDRNVTVLPVAPNGTVDWEMPAGGEPEMDYVLRVYDSAGRYDETHPLPLSRSATRQDDSELDGPIIAAGEGEDRTARRTIPVRGGAVTVSGRDVPAGTRITVMGEEVRPDLRRGFVMQRILPPGDHGVQIGVGSQSLTRPVTIPTKEVFATGIADVTLGRDLVADETWTRGRIASYVDSTLADGTRITASVDTREEELKDMFRDFGRKHPDQVLRGIEDEDVWVTTGDDSITEDLAPTSGKVFARIERDGSFLQWGDFKPAEDLRRVVRSDRTLYGLTGTWLSPATTDEGEARIRTSAYVSSPDTLMQRDVLRGTGGSAYFLSRRDIQEGSESLIIEVRDPVSGRVISATRLVEGRDYRIDHVQGLVILTKPLSPMAGGAGLVVNRPLGNYDVNLVAQYEYVPTTGSVDGISAGGRAEGWVTDKLRFGMSGARETTGIADNTLLGADVLWRHSENSWLSFEVAQSEGPGFGSTFSLNGGLEIDPATPSAGIKGKSALGYRLEGQADLADFGGKGHVSAYYDDREAGFTSPDLDVGTPQTTFGLEGEVGVSDRMALTFGADRFEDTGVKERTDARLGLSYDLDPAYTLDVEVATTDRTAPGSTLAEDNGTRTDLGARLTWTRDEDLSAWVFGQVTADHGGSLGRNDRLGLGVETRLSDALTLMAEGSDGSLGGAGKLQLAWAPNADTTYTMGYRQDPLRMEDSTTVTGHDRGTLVLGANSRINDAWRYNAEHSYSAFGSEPALTTTYGVTYTPSEVWRYDLGILSGTNTESDGTTIERQGLSLGMRWSGGEGDTAGLRGELRFEDSDNPARVQDRRSILVAGAFERRTSDDWRLIGGLDAVISDADTDNLLDGRYVEAKLGYAYRPVANDRLNALASYTWLYDMPGADQVNVDGNVNGPKQRSHILNAALSYDLNQQFTLGAKYGFRLREEAARGTNTFITSTAHLAILRLDYHIVHNWDILAEGRAMAYPKADTTEFGALLGVYRDLNDNVRLGAGYSWGGVSDDLRSLERDREGLFVNLIGKF